MTDNEIRRIKYRARQQSLGVTPYSIRNGQPIRTPAEKRRISLKYKLRIRHADHINETIDKLEERLVILKEIRDELQAAQGPA